MKTIARFLGWMLALSITVALLGVPAEAKDFSDAGSINYKEAVDVVSSIGIMDGYSDISFKPANTLTRGAAAKIVCNMILGPTTAGALPISISPFPDVSAGSVFAGYIMYCSEHGIISGYADGNFRPADSLSGYAFLKMLLGALGYDQKIEGYQGANWRINVATQARGIELDKGLISELDGNRIVTREEAALYVFNTLQADIVEYGSRTTVSVSGALVTVGSNTPQVRTWSREDIGAGNIDSNSLVNGRETVQFAEEYFSRLERKTVEKEGFIGRQWFYKSVLIGTYYGDGAAILYDPDLSVPANYTRKITFDANGGTASQNSKTVANGETYGTLPTATRNGYTFDGWYTSPSGGNLITSSSPVNLNGDQTLYAHWTAVPPSTTVDIFAYNFKNDAVAFSYKNPEYSYPIPLDRYIFVFGKTARAKQVMRFDFKRGWGGNCYGMVSTSGLFYQSGNSISVSGYHRGASHPYELSLSDSNGNLTLREFIEAMQISQSSVEFCTARDSNMDNLNGLVRAVTAFQESGGMPVIICMFGRMNEKESGHAVIAYRMENTSETQSRVYVYDPNFPRDANRYITLTRSGNQYTGWSYMMNDMYEWGRSQNGISYIPYDTVLSCWSRRGNLVPDDRCRLMSMNVDNAAIYDENGNTLAIVENGQVVQRQSGVHQLLYLGGQTNSQTSGTGTISMWLPQRELYSVEISGNQEGIYRVSLVDVEEGIDVETTAHEVGLSADDSTETYTVEIHEADCQYVGRRILPSGSTSTSGATGGSLYAGASGSSGTSDPFDDGPIVGYGVTGQQGVVVKVTGGVVDITE